VITVEDHIIRGEVAVNRCSDMFPGPQLLDFLKKRMTDERKKPGMCRAFFTTDRMVKMMTGKASEAVHPPLGR
jgi:hypothetical protein